MIISLLMISIYDQSLRHMIYRWKSQPVLPIMTLLLWLVTY